MMIGIVGKKLGMTRIFTEQGVSVPVTVVEVPSNRVVRLFKVKSDGYNAVQVAWGQRKPQKALKAQLGQYAKAKVECAEGLIEYRLDSEAQDFQVGAEINVTHFSVGQKVDVQGKTLGKGFAGVIKRHHFSHQRMTHGNSRAHRAPGSIGQCQFPGKVFKGKKMAGHLGDCTRTVQNLEVVAVDVERRLVLIKGAVPASKGSRVVVRPAIKFRNQLQAQSSINSQEEN
ncbi:MAG: 50S ribosomal protein L3 [Candidatus Eutrophobiaceae bacterium]